MTDDELRKKKEQIDMLQAEQGSAPAPEQFDSEQGMIDTINQYKSKIDEGDKELTWKDRLPDMLAALHNTINYGSNSRQPNMDMNYASGIQKQRSASKKENLANLNNLKKMYGDYSTKKENSAYKKANLDRQLKADKYREESDVMKYKEREKDRDFEASQTEKAMKLKERMRMLNQDDRMAFEDYRQSGNRKTQADMELLRNKNMLERAKLDAKLKDDAKKVLSKKQEADIKLANDKLKNTAKVPTFGEKEQIKADVKEKMAVSKENRKTRKETEGVISGIEDQIKSVKKARDLVKNASKSGLSDTGPVDQYSSKMSDRGQALEQAINQVSLDKMVKMFAGMSKAIDSDAERAFFQASQPAMNKYPAANIKILDDMLVNLESLKTKNSNLRDNITTKGERVDVDRPEKKQAMSIDPKIKEYADQYELSYEKAEQVLRSRGYNGKK